MYHTLKTKPMKSQIKVKDQTLYDGHMSNIPSDIRESINNHLETNQFDKDILLF